MATPGRQSDSSSRRYRYTKVLDNRKHAIRGLWRRNGRFVARITVEDDMGRRTVKWVPLDAETAAEAQGQFLTLLVERSEDRLRPIGLAPKFADYLDHYDERLGHSGEKPQTLVTERSHLHRWREALGHVRLDKIRPHQITAKLHRTKASGR